jgi:protein gp37
MGDKTSIEWTEATWNPIRGCTRVSPGCRHCYAEEIAARFSGPGQAYEGLAEMTESGPRWTGKLLFVAEHLSDPLRWKRPRRIFVNSMSDLFHEELSFDEIDRIFAVMSLARHHVFQVLTKRPERMLKYLGRTEEEQEARQEAIGEAGYRDHEIMFSGAPDCGEDFHYLEWPLSNVWLGTSVENQKTADKRIPFLLKAPAAVRWLSCEPLLGPLELSIYFASGYDTPPQNDIVDWVVVGGESGADARPMHPDWVRAIRMQCKLASVPLFFKQWGSYVEAPEGLSGVLVETNGKHCAANFQSIEERRRYSEEGSILMRYIGKKKAGRVLDGLTWDEYPITD